MPRRPRIKLAGKPSTLSYLLTGFFSLAATLSIISCSAEEEIKNQIIDEMRGANGKDTSVDLNTFSEKKIFRLCIQTPYLTRQKMEERIGVKIDDFYEVDDKFFVLWMLKDRQPPTRIKFHRGRELNFGEQSKACVFTSRVKIINSQLHLSEEK